jgi:hypothetical protein
MASENRAPQIAALERNNIMTPSIDFLERSVPDAAKVGRANADALMDSCQLFLRIRANCWRRNRCGNQCGSRTVFLVVVD